MNRQKALANRSLFISCIVPIHNESANIVPFFKQLNDKLNHLTEKYEIIAINDGSTDDSQIELLKAHETWGIKILEFSRNFGKEIALSAGLEHSHGDVVIIMDGDFQHPFETLDAFLTEWSTGYDMVYGLRKDRQDESRSKRYFANLFYQIMAKISPSDIPPNAGDFRLLDKKIVSALNASKERVRFMKGLYGWAGYRSKGVFFDVQQRRAGQSSWQFRKLFNLALVGIVSFSDLPLRVWSIIGCFISLLSFLAILYIIFDTLFFGIQVPGYATLLITIIFFGGIQLLSIGILGEYIARIFNEVKQRPLYLLNTKWGFEENSN